MLVIPERYLDLADYCRTRMRSTISRQLSALDDRSVELFERVQRRLVYDALESEQLSWITLDFDGSVLDTCRYAEGVSCGYNSREKGQLNLLLIGIQ